ncbi:hypothetical protein C4K30_4867 [Pseudomonas chlororaphis subsp. piscium]|nr:hypothetical protein C4K30_4867 [Pseudomonas chlororaphis subsp. piscium]
MEPITLLDLGASDDGQNFQRIDMYQLPRIQSANVISSSQTTTSIAVEPRCFCFV